MSGTVGIRVALVAMSLAAVSAAGSVEVEREREFYRRAEIAEKRKQHQVAEQHLRQAVAIEPGQIGRVVDLGEFLARHGRYEECDELFRMAEEKNSDSPRLMFARARLEIHSGRNLNEARKLLRNYLASPITSDDPPRSEALRLVKMAWSQ